MNECIKQNTAYGQLLIFMNNEEIAWVAGILEGEGCFDFNDIYLRNYPRVRLEMKDEDIIRRVHALIGGKIYFRKRKQKQHSDTYRLTINQRFYLEPLLLQILPWLGTRRKVVVQEQIDWYNAHPVVYNGDKVVHKIIGRRGIPRSLEVRAKISASLKGKSKKRINT